MFTAATAEIWKQIDVQKQRFIKDLAVSKKRIVQEISKNSNTKNLEYQTVSELNQKNLKFLDKEVEMKLKRIQDAARL